VAVLIETTLGAAVASSPATAEEIAQVPGIGPSTASAIKDAVAERSGKTVSVNTATGEIEEH
jgi:excinuclease ABC subunit C